VPERARERVNGGWPCYGVYETGDGGHVTLGALEPQFWANFCRLTGREDLRPLQHVEGAERDRVEGELRRLFRTRSRAEWVALLHQVDVCAGPVLGLDEVVRDPQLVQRGLFTEVEHPKLGPVRQVAFPVRLSATPGRVATPAPELGEHTDEVLRGLGYAPEAILTFRRDGVVA
jgi:crotonobetainyl-CoA:carnitine CoA-transferase CaiB-like acyl-CoA transferase